MERQKKLTSAEIRKEKRERAKEHFCFYCGGSTISKEVYCSPCGDKPSKPCPDCGELIYPKNSRCHKCAPNSPKLLKKLITGLEKRVIDLEKYQQSIKVR